MIGPDGFDAMYRDDPDPFGVATRWYEQRKQAVLVATLARARYDLVWDCASGTGRLGATLLEQDRCARLLATDASPAAVGLSADLLARWPAATCATSALPDVATGAEAADLTVAAEVLYYLPDAERAAAVAMLARQRGEVVTVHWRHLPHDAHLSGADVTEELGAGLVAAGWAPVARHDDTDFVLASWTDERRTAVTALDALLPAALTLPPAFDRHAAPPGAMRTACAALVPDDAGQMPWPALLEHLVAVGRTDVPTARLVEAHVDALRIHAQAGTSPVPGALYAVWASRSRETGITGVRSGDGWVLDGTLRFASGSGIVDRALVPVWTAPTTHVLLDLDVSGWAFDGSAWRTPAMAPARSHTTTLSGFATHASPVGADDFYLDRPGFFPGGVGVAAAWIGGALRVHDLLATAVPAARRTPAQQVRVGRVRTDLVAGLAAVRQAGPLLQEGATDDHRLLPTLVRAAVATGVRRVLAEARAVAGPAGMAFDHDLLRAVDDLALFVGQQNEDADALWLGGP